MRKPDRGNIKRLDPPEEERRKYLRTVGALAVGLAVGGAAGWLSKPAERVTERITETVTKTVTAPITPIPTPTPTPTPTPATLRFYGAGFTIYPECVDAYSKATNGRVTLEYQGLPLAVACEKALATKGEGWDITSNATSYSGILTGAEPPVLQPIDVEKIPNWTNTPPEGLAEYVQKPEILKSEYISEDVMDRIRLMLFKDGVPPEWNGTQWIGAKVWGVATGGNFEGIGYLPEYIPYEEVGEQKFTFGYEEKFNPEWKGHVGMQDDVCLACGWTSLMLTYLNEAKFEGFDGTNARLTKGDIDIIINYLLPYVEGGQIRTFAADYGAMLAAMTSREVWIMQCWQPVVMGTRAAGIPAYWARTPHGGEFWWSPDMVSIKTPILDECINWLNWRMGPWWLSFIMMNGYYCWRWNTEDVKKEMGYEKWAWQYNGDPTYKTLEECMKDCWPDNEEFWTAPDRIRNALFHPDLYHWSKEKGTPNPKGALKDHGSYTDCMKHQVGWIAEIPENVDYMIERWSWLKAQLKR